MLGIVIRSYVSKALLTLSEILLTIMTGAFGLAGYHFGRLHLPPEREG